MCFTYVIYYYYNYDDQYMSILIHMNSEYEQYLTNNKSQTGLHEQDFVNNEFRSFNLSIMVEIDLNS